MQTTLRQYRATARKTRKAWSRNANAKRLRNIAEQHDLAMRRIEAELREDDMHPFPPAAAQSVPVLGSHGPRLAMIARHSAGAAAGGTTL